MSLAAKLLSASGGGVDKLYVDDVFSAYTYTGNGSTQTINNGIDLAGKGGLVWVKSRGAATEHSLVDTARGASNNLVSNGTYASGNYATVTGFNSNGFNLGSQTVANANAVTFASWTFRKAPKFFDVVTYTGTGANRTISHALGQEVGMIYVKRTDTAADWQVYHRSLANTEYMVLNSSAAKATGATRWNSTTPTTSVFSVGTDTTVNASGGTFVAYLFAHDTSADGIVQCGSFTIDGSGNATVSLGWEPQYLMVKSSVSATFNDWLIMDSSRTLTATAGTQAPLKANTSDPENSWNGSQYQPNATGFKAVGNANISATLIYLAIRRPNKPPTTGTQVYNAIARTGTGAAATVTGVGFAPDLVMPQARTGASIWGAHFWDRLRGAIPNLNSSSTVAERTADTTALTAFGMDGVAVGSDSTFYINNTGYTYINHFFKRAPGVLDQVCYTGTNVARTEAHNLGAAPELWIVKARNFGTDWIVGCTALAANESMCLNDTTAKTVSPEYWNNTRPTSANFSLSTHARVNGGYNYVAYLFATKAGISKVFSYTGNGTSQTIDCGFTTGARFVLIKRTDATGDWYIWDTVRGLVAGNDPHLSLNTTAAEVTTNDSLDPANAGFIVNQLAATNINVTSATYIYLAFA